MLLISEEECFIKPNDVGVILPINILILSLLKNIISTTDRLVKQGLMIQAYEHMVIRVGL
jgi:hypothetical protein